MCLLCLSCPNLLWQLGDSPLIQPLTLTLMASWIAANNGAWHDFNIADGATDLTDWLPDDRSTLAGGLLILGHAPGVRRLSHAPP